MTFVSLEDVQGERLKLCAFPRGVCYHILSQPGVQSREFDPDQILLGCANPYRVLASRNCA
jgi:hypothetical protein